MSDEIQISDAIPFDIQVEILKKLAVKPLIKFTSVSKQWMSLIRSRSFIAGYGSREAHPHRLLVTSYEQHQTGKVEKYVCFLDNDDSTFTQQEFAPRVPNVLTKLLNHIRIVGTSHGLLCFYGYNYPSNEKTEHDMVILWNPSIRKSIGITLPSHLGWPDKGVVIGFGVCPITSDPVVLKSTNLDGWQAEVFTLSSGIWKRVSSKNLPPRESVRLTWRQVVIDRFIYFVGYDRIDAMGLYGSNNLFNTIVSFDMTTKEFAILDLPDNLAHQSLLSLTVSKIKDKLVVPEYKFDVNIEKCVVWMMMMDHQQGLTKSFTKLFTINTPIDWVLGFNKNGDPIVETNEDYGYGKPWTLGIYQRSSQHVNDLGIFEGKSFFMGSYMETLLLLDQPDCVIY